MKRSKPPRLNYSFEGRQEVPQEKNDITEAKWVAKPASFRRFIDDGFSLSKLNFENSFGFRIVSILDLRDQDRFMKS